MSETRAGAPPPIPPGANLERLDGNALLSTVKAATVITDNLEAVLRDSGSGLHANDWDALALLVAVGPMRPAELLRLTALTNRPATLHKILNRLETRGWVSRAQHPEHASGVVYAATDEGHATVARLFPIIEAQVIKRFAGHYSTEELATLSDLTARLYVPRVKL